MSFSKFLHNLAKGTPSRQYCVVCHRSAIPGAVTYNQKNGKWEFDCCTFGTPTDPRCAYCITALTAHLNSDPNNPPRAASRFEVSFEEGKYTLRSLEDNQ